MEILNFVAAIVLIYALYKIFTLRKPITKEDGTKYQMPWGEMKPTLYLGAGALIVSFLTNLLHGFFNI